MQELWKDIPGYEGLYQVSNCGRVRSVDRLVLHRKNGLTLYKGRVLNARPTKKGYPLVCLSIGSKIKYCYVHRLVAEAFCERSEGDYLVRHLDDVKTRNVVENLAWGTMVDNYADYLENKK